MSLKSLIATGTKVWLDGVEPVEIAKSRLWGITGATSNPTIVSKIISHGGFDRQIQELGTRGLTDEAIAWTLDDRLVRYAQHVFFPVWMQTLGDDGYVSFELDPLIEENESSPRARVRQYVELGKKWSANHKNRMIKVPATDAGFEAMEVLASAGVTINATLIFTERQYLAAREAVWAGAQRRKDGLNDFKSAYSVFVSRLDVYARDHVPELSAEAQENFGIENAKWIWRENQEFWKKQGLRLRQEIVFASTGVKNLASAPNKYVEAFAGGDIVANSMATNEAVEKSGKTYRRHIEQMPAADIVSEIDSKLNVSAMKGALLQEGIRKFADLQRGLLGYIARIRSAPAAHESLAKHIVHS